MRSFLGFGQVQYIGAPYCTPVKFAGIAGQQVPLLFNWFAYGASTARPNINVAVSIESQVCAKLDQIRSVYIDNLGSNQPIYVYFPDTQITITCQPNAEGWFPAFTNAKTCWVIAEGFLTGDVGSTLVTLCNVPVPAGLNVELQQSVSLWKASPTITRGSSIYNTALGAPALGDQIQATAQLSLSVLGATVNLWNTPYASGFLYITDLSLYVINANMFALGATKTIQVVIESTGIAGILATPFFVASQLPIVAAVYSGDPALGRQTPLSLRGNIKLDATQTWRARTAIACDIGACQLNSTFTQSTL